MMYPPPATAGIVEYRDHRDASPAPSFPIPERIITSGFAATTASRLTRGFAADSPAKTFLPRETDRVVDKAPVRNGHVRLVPKLVVHGDTGTSGRPAGDLRERCFHRSGRGLAPFGPPGDRSDPADLPGESR